MFYNLILFILINFGISYIVTQSHLFKGLRNLINRIEPKYLGEFIQCALCFGTWSAFILSFVYSPTFLIFTNIRIVSIFLDGILGGITAYLICVILNYFKKS